MREMAEASRNVHPEIWARWHSIVGPQMYRRAFPRSLKGRVLVVGVANSSWMQELGYMKRGMMDRLEEEVGPGVVEEIRFVLDGGTRPED
jgi:predicted nucleic acid-binding Zn ribbon protein